MGERSARDDADKARSHRNPAPSPTDDDAEGEASEKRNPGRSNMDRPVEAKPGRSETKEN